MGARPIGPDPLHPAGRKYDSDGSSRGARDETSRTAGGRPGDDSGRTYRDDSDRTNRSGSVAKADVSVGCGPGGPRQQSAGTACSGAGVGPHQEAGAYYGAAGALAAAGRSVGAAATGNRQEGGGYATGAHRAIGRPAFTTNRIGRNGNGDAIHGPTRMERTRVAPSEAASPRAGWAELTGRLGRCRVAAVRVERTGPVRRRQRGAGRLGRGGSGKSSEERPARKIGVETVMDSGLVTAPVEPR